LLPKQPEPAILSVNDLTVHYGGICALHQINMHLNQGEIVAVIGANGAGKSTLLKTIAGTKAQTSGSILLDGETLPKQAHQVVRRGVMLVPEGRRIFAPLSVKENLMLGAYSRNDSGEIQDTLHTIFALFPVLEERLSQRGGTLSGGEQQMLAIGRALMSHPRILLLDEPSLGLAPIVVDALFRKIIQLNREMALTILLVEQNASLALDISHRGYVLETGENTIEGSGKELLANQKIKESYLGVARAGG
jgi:branched-chain amino acid transport system ATP-binding protein